MDDQRSVFVLEQEGVNIEGGGKIKHVIDFLESHGLFVVLDSVDLEEESFRRSLDPAVLLDPDNLSFFVAVVVNVRDGDLFAGVVELSMLGVDEEQTEQLLLSLVDVLFLVDEGVLNLSQKLLSND